MTDVVGEARSTTASVRTVILLNAASLPLSFATNMILGRVSADAVGYYGAVTVVISTYYTFFVIGGSLVFSRFLPAIPAPNRLSFLLTYTTIVLLTFAALVAFVPQAAPDLLGRALQKFGGPSWPVVAAVLFATIPAGMATYFLYGTLRPGQAIVAEKTVVAGFFLAAVFGYGVWREALASDPARFIWFAGLGAYAAAAVVGVVLVARSDETRSRPPIRWMVPAGFWSVVFYTHVSTVVGYVHSQLSPALVLVWLDVASLGRLHAASRYVLLLTFIPSAVASVLAPVTSRLEAFGFRREAFNQLTTAVNAMLLFLVPAVLALTLFAGDAMAIFGPGFQDYRHVLRLLAVSALSQPVVESGPGVAAALGAFRSYLAASLVYVISAVVLAAILVPSFGLAGAALAVTFGSIVREGTMLFVLRRLGFLAPRRLGVAWLCAAVAVVVALVRDPGRSEAAAEWLALTVLFLWLGRLTVDEVKFTLRWLLGGHSRLG